MKTAVKRSANVDYGLAGRFRESLLFVAPFPSHKWITDAEKARYYRAIQRLLDGRLPTPAESIKVIA